VTDALAALQQREVGLKGIGIGITPLSLAFASFKDDFVQFERGVAHGTGEPLRGHIGQSLRREAGAGFVEHHAQRVEVGRRRAGAFGRNVAFGANKCPTLTIGRDQPDVRELRPTVDVDYVARLYVAVDQAVPVELCEAAGHIDRKPKAMGGG